MIAKRIIPGLLLITFISLTVAFPFAALGASSGPNTPDTCVSDNSNGGAEPWVNPSNAITDNGSNASTGNITGSEFTHYLKCTDFDFSIPTDATIDGIVVDWERLSVNSATEAKDQAVRIVKGDVVGSTDKTSATVYPTTATIASYGSSSDKWGETWTYSDINSTTFGAALASQDHDAIGLPQVDYVRITVYYTEAAGGSASQTQVQVINYF